MTLGPVSGLPRQNLEEIFTARIQAFANAHRFYAAAVHRFLSYLLRDFPQLCRLSDLRRDPHLLGWLRSLCHDDRPLSQSTRRIYLIGLRRLFHDLAAQGHALQAGLILAEDFSPCADLRRPLPRHAFAEIFDARIQTLSTTLRPDTIQHYRSVARHFLSFLQRDFPQLRQLSELRRNPHLLGWFRYLCLKNPPLCNATRTGYLLALRRLFFDLAFDGYSVQPGLILPEDFPPPSQYLPRALSPEEDHRLQQELRRNNDLLSNALLLTRATGIRIGECIALDVDCLRSVGQDGQGQWALHVPLGKLHTERLVPVDQDVQQIVVRILSLRASAPASQLAKSAGLLLPRSAGSHTLYQQLRLALDQAAKPIGCSHPITPHRLRHTYATEMLRLGVSLPALMKLLGHKSISMTLRYLKVTQQDLQREFHDACLNAAHSHPIPALSLPGHSRPVSSDLPAIRRALGATRHLLEMYRRRLEDEKARHKLQRLDKRLLNVELELNRFATAEK